MFKLCFYVPESHLEKVKGALFAAGAGKIGAYDCCCWQTKGTGQFRPLEGSKPHIGTEGKIQIVDEYKVEMVCDDRFIGKAVKALKEAHPYEMPAYDVWELSSKG